MCGEECSCGKVINVRPHELVKLALLISLAALTSCTTVKERIEIRTLQPQIIEKHYIPVPVEMDETERNKEAQNYA